MKRTATVVALMIGLIWLASSAQAYQVRVGANVATSLFYAIQTGSSYAGFAGTRDIRQPDLTNFATQVDGYFSIIFVSDDRSTGAHVKIALTSGPVAGTNAVNLYYLYGWYRFGRCTLEVGHMDNLFAPATYAPYGALGFNALIDGSGGFYEFGKLYSGRFAQVALYYKAGPWTLMAALGAVPRNSDNLPTTQTFWGPVTNVFQMNQIYPRLDLAAQYRGRWFALAPGFSIYRTEWETWEGAPNLQDDHIWSWAFVIPFKLVVGNFGLTGEAGIGQNWAVPNMLNTWQFATWWGSARTGFMNKVADTRLYTLCLGLFYRVGRATIWLSGGWQMAQNGSSDVIGAWRHGQNVRFAFVLAVPYRVNRHFTVAPEVGYYFYGWNPTEDVGPVSQGGTVTADLGLAWIVGVRFYIHF